VQLAPKLHPYSYVKAHPEMARKVSLDLREIRLEESGPLSQKDHIARVIKARADLAQLFDEHPALQAQAEDTFQDALVRSPDSADHWERDWAHISHPSS
jgi:hypothetical protein